MPATKTLEVEDYEDEEAADCADCGNVIEDGDPVVWEPAPEVHPLAVVPVHPGCAVRNGFGIRWPR